MKKVKHGNSRDVARTLQTSRMESFATMFNGFVIVAKLSIQFFAGVLVIPLEIV